ncbi:MAG: hypothetical protein RL651_898 [Pseudomonadota bacterium]
MRVKASLESYHKEIRAVFSVCPTDTTSALFEVNTSRIPSFSNWIVTGRFDAAILSGSLCYLMFRSCIRDLAKWGVIWILGQFLYSRRSQHLRELPCAERIFVGFVTLRANQLTSKDYDGFRESLSGGLAELSFGLRLPFVGLKRYLEGDANVLPVLAYVRFNDVVSGIRRQLKLARVLASSPGVSPAILATFRQDVATGHPVASYVIGKTVGALCRKTAPQTTLYFPMERHDWEQIALANVSGIRRVEAVQNCTFSPLDLNMYLIEKLSPAYRQAMPDCLHVLDDSWGDVFQNELGFSCEIRQLEKHRFSNECFKLQLDGRTPRLLYIGSINPVKLQLDLEALASLRNHVTVEVRLHPSLSNYTLPAGFARSIELNGRFGWCVFADTSLVFQIDCARDYMIFIEHDSIPTQDPTAWFPNFGSSRMVASDVASLCARTQDCIA